ncbi:hypothetical protein ACG2OD_14670 [Streptomyces sp. PDY-4]|uniref:hypothetical protein n=1 Tax=Streptomyces sp. PDY-4 TaxID=3376070 RepID=UPI0037BA0806
MQSNDGPSLDPVLKTGMSKRNIASAEKALARIKSLGWVPLAPYPGSDTHWQVRCVLCQWEGVMFYSHMRRERRHKGCIAPGLRAAAIEGLNNSR